MSNKHEGDISFTLDLQTNMLLSAQYVLENFDSPLQSKYINIYLKEVGTFFELFFKYKLMLINPSLIWLQPEKYDSDKHSKADFKSISAERTIALAKNLGWLDNKEYQIVDKYRLLRNKLAHFSAYEFDDEVNSWPYEKFPYYDQVKIKSLTKKLLLEHHDILCDNPFYNIILSQDYFTKE